MPRGGQKDEAIIWLRQAIECKEGFDPSGDNYFESLDKRTGVSAPGRRYSSRPTGCSRSALAFSIAEKDLIPEGIAYDPKGNAFYLGTLQKKNRKSHLGWPGKPDFKKPREDGLWQVLGMKADGHGGSGPAVPLDLKMLL